MTGPPVCSTCDGAYLLWWHGAAVGPGWPTQASASPMCWYHDSVRMQSNGGLPVAEYVPPALDQLLASFDRADERQALRLRGVRYTVTFGGIPCGGGGVIVTKTGGAIYSHAPQERHSPWLAKKSSFGPARKDEK